MNGVLGFPFPLIAAAILAGCQDTYVRYQNNSHVSQEQFLKDRFACYLETRQTVPFSTTTQYSGLAGSAV